MQLESAGLPELSYRYLYYSQRAVPYALAEKERGVSCYKLIYSIVLTIRQAFLWELTCLR